MFVGNTAISTARLSQIAASYEHKKLTLQDLKALTLKVNDIYRVEGYFLAQAVIPAQSMERNEIKILVFEGRVGEVQIEGNKHYARRFIRRFFEPAIRAGLIRRGPLHRSLLLLNDFLDLEVQSIFQKGKKPGTADVVLKVACHCGAADNGEGRKNSCKDAVGGPPPPLCRASMSLTPAGGEFDEGVGNPLSTWGRGGLPAPAFLRGRRHGSGRAGHCPIGGRPQFRCVE